METPKKLVAKGINEDGQRELMMFMARNLNRNTIRSIVSAFAADIVYHDGTATLTIAGCHTEDGEPVSLFFSEDHLLYSFTKPKE